MSWLCGKLELNCRSSIICLAPEDDDVVSLLFSLSLSLCCSLSLSLSVHLWRNLLASCNKPLHMRRLAGYTHTHTLKLGLKLATGGGSDQLQFRVQCACHKKFVVPFFVFLINKIIKAITTTRETNFVCCVGKLRCHPVADTIQDQVWVLPTNYAHATN